MEKQSPLLRLWELGKDYHGGLVGAICSASIGVLCGMLPYFAAAQIIIGFSKIRSRMLLRMENVDLWDRDRASE